VRPLRPLISLKLHFTKTIMATEQTSSVHDAEQQIEPSTLGSVDIPVRSLDLGPWEHFEGHLFLILCFVIIFIVQEMAESIYTPHFRYDVVLNSTCERQFSLICPRNVSSCGGNLIVSSCWLMRRSVGRENCIFGPTQ